jgi:Rod binding domain-containing protein
MSSAILSALANNQQALASQSSLTPAQLEQARKAAVDFEGVTIGEMLQPMFDTVDLSDSMFGGGVGEKQFRDLQVQEMGKQIANNGGLGIANSVYRQLLAMQEQAQS